MGISDRIRRAIEMRGLSLKEAAARCGIPYSTLQNWVGDIREPRLEGVAAISSHLGISADWLLTGEGEPIKAQGSAGLTPKQFAVLQLYDALSEDDQREICSAAQEKKRLRELEQHYQELRAELDQLKGLA